MEKHVTTNPQEKGLNRNTLDKYYTKHEIVKLVVNLVKQFINIDCNDLIIEPSAGNGSFIPELKKFNCNCKFFDIQPEHNSIENIDYLKIENSKLKVHSSSGKIHVIGNPPFGRQSSLAIKFIKKSCEFCDSFSFILPKSFKKDSLKKHIPLNFHCLHEENIPDNSFLVDSQEHDVPCIFQIYMKNKL